MRYIALIAVLLFIPTAAAALLGHSTTQPTAPATTQPGEAARVIVYAAIVRPGPTWLANRAAGRRNDMARHFEYVRTKREQGKLLFGGPFADGAGGLLVYRADSLEQARDFMEADPATQDKVFEYDLHPWQLNAADLSHR